MALEGRGGGGGGGERRDWGHFEMAQFIHMTRRAAYDSNVVPIPL